MEEARTEVSLMQAENMQISDLEHCLVVPRARLLSRIGDLPSGFQRGTVEEVLDAITAWGRFVPRGEAESDPSLKQIIPYCVVGHQGEIFLMRRKRGGAESRLHDKLSLGVGGHVNPVDVPPDGDLRRSVVRALEREIDEELRVDSPSRKTCLGILNDDSNAVGQVHLGFIYCLELERPVVAVREEESLEGKFVGKTDLLAVQDRMETWSRILAPLVVGDRWSRRSNSRCPSHEARQGTE